jgi:hypothetical protein
MPFGSWPDLVEWSAREPQQGKWRDVFSGTTRFFLPTCEQEKGARPLNYSISPNLAKNPFNVARFHFLP